jgi:hypothetical protein
MGDAGLDDAMRRDRAQLAGRRPEITRSSVVLPAPFAPSTATASPASTFIETSNSAWKPA